MTQGEANKATLEAYDLYADLAGRVVDTITERHITHGNPETFGECFAGLLTAYMRPVVQSGRPFLPADSFIVLDLLKTARIACGGVHLEHFHDKVGYALLGQAHVARINALAAERQAAMEAAAEATRTAPEAPEAPEGDGVPRAPSGAPLVMDDMPPCQPAVAPRGPGVSAMVEAYAAVLSSERELGCPLCGAVEGEECRADGEPCWHSLDARSKVAVR